jgi:hypothetical protein
MLKKIQTISFNYKQEDNLYGDYKNEIENYWNQFVQTHKNYFNGDILSVCDLKEQSGDFKISFNYIKFADVAYSKMVGNIKTRSLFSGGYIITKDGYICFVVDKHNSLSLVGGTAALEDVVNDEYNPDLCMIREFKEEIGLDITDINFSFNKMFLKCPDEEDNKKCHFPIGVLYEIKTSYTKQELDDLFNSINHDNELKTIVFLEPNNPSQLDKYTKKDYLDDLYGLIKVV